MRRTRSLLLSVLLLLAGVPTAVTASSHLETSPDAQPVAPAWRGRALGPVRGRRRRPCEHDRLHRLVGHHSGLPRRDLPTGAAGRAGSDGDLHRLHPRAGRRGPPELTGGPVLGRSGQPPRDGDQPARRGGCRRRDRRRRVRPVETVTRGQMATFLAAAWKARSGSPVALGWRLLRRR